MPLSTIKKVNPPLTLLGCIFLKIKCKSLLEYANLTVNLKPASSWHGILRKTTTLVRLFTSMLRLNITLKPSRLQLIMN